MKQHDFFPSLFVTAALVISIIKWMVDGPWWYLHWWRWRERERGRGWGISAKIWMIIGCKVMDREREGERERERSGFISYMFIFPVAECPRSLISPLMGTPGRTQFRSEKHFLPKRWVMELLNCPITLNWSICAPTGIAIYTISIPCLSIWHHMTYFSIPSESTQWWSAKIYA